MMTKKDLREKIRSYLLENRDKQETYVFSKPLRYLGASKAPYKLPVKQKTDILILQKASIQETISDSEPPKKDPFRLEEIKTPSHKEEKNFFSFYQKHAPHLSLQKELKRMGYILTHQELKPHQPFLEKIKTAIEKEGYPCKLIEIASEKELLLHIKSRACPTLVPKKLLTLFGAFDEVNPSSHILFMEELEEYQHQIELKKALWKQIKSYLQKQ